MINNEDIEFAMDEYNKAKPYLINNQDEPKPVFSFQNSNTENNNKEILGD